MAQLKAVPAAESMIKSILDNRVKEKEELEAQIKTDEAAIAAAAKAMEDATAAGNVKAYQQAKRDRQDASDAKEMHESRLDTLNNKTLISAVDYEKTVENIFTEIASLDKQTKEKLCKLSEEMYSSALELQTAINQANDVLHSLQHDIYRDADRQRSANGTLYANDEKQVKKWGTVSWGKACFEHFQYQEYTGKKIK